MANGPVPTQHDVVIQNDTTGNVDFLHFIGTSLVESAEKNYSLGTVWKIVANGDFNADLHPDLVAQNKITGQLDFLFLDGSGNLFASALSNVAVPSVHGAGTFGTFAPGQVGQNLVSQLANGQIDLLAFDGNGHLIASDLIPNSVGLPHVVGVASGAGFFPAFSLLGSSNSVITQLPDGSIDALGFSGNFGNASVTFSTSLLLPGTAGSPTLGAVNQDFGDVSFAGGHDVNAQLTGSDRQTVEMVGTTSTGQIDLLFFNSGFNENPVNRGAEIGTSLLNLSIPGWSIVDGGIVAHTDFFPIV